MRAGKSPRGLIRSGWHMEGRTMAWGRTAPYGAGACRWPLFPIARGRCSSGRRMSFRAGHRFAMAPYSERDKINA